MKSRCLRVAVDRDGVVRTGVTQILDADPVLVAPEAGGSRAPGSRPSIARAARAPWRAAASQCALRASAPRSRVEAGRDVAGGEDVLGPVRPQSSAGTPALHVRPVAPSHGASGSTPTPTTT